ncbi:TPA: hypothetical protein DIV49_02185 [Candidatus Saccharibacteria bacterium]|nr:hypothetical protein [Candidatus Saccharibacteria bacterium]HRJ90702.1 hypothetical protein [Candidatus Saccharibacteria bacterium]
MASEKDSGDKKDKPSVGGRALVYLGRKGLQAISWAIAGKDGEELMKYSFLGICEDGIIGGRMCLPDEQHDHLTYRTANAGQWMSYDFRRAEFFPHVAEKLGDNFSLYDEGILTALLLEGLASRPVDARTELTIDEMISFETVLSSDKPGISTLLELGMVARRSHEDAYEQAGATAHIDELRIRGVAQEPVYQVTPKGHGLISLEDEGGSKPPRKKAILETAKPRILIA